MDLIFHLYHGNLCLTQCQKDLFLWFLLEVLCFNNFTFRSIVYLKVILNMVLKYDSSWVNFYIVCEVQVKVYFFTYEYLIVVAPFDEKTILSAPNRLCIFVKTQLSMYVGAKLTYPLFCSIYLSVHPDSDATLSWSGVCKWQPMGQLLIVQIKFHCNRDTHSFIYCLCLWLTMMAEVSGKDRDHMAHKPELFTVWSRKENICQLLVLIIVAL